MLSVAPVSPINRVGRESLLPLSKWTLQLLIKDEWVDAHGAAFLNDGKPNPTFRGRCSAMASHRAAARQLLSVMINSIPDDQQWRIKPQ